VSVKNQEKIGILGHERIIEDLKRLAGNGNLAHGYLFFGEERIGKRLVALSFANYLESGEFAPPKEGRVLNDATIVGPEDGGSVGIDAVRRIKSFLWQRPNRSSRRTVILDRSELLTDEAQNALLKITEEPPASSLLVLVVKEPEMLQATLRSRLQRVHFSGFTVQEIASWLRAQKLASGKEAEAIARRSFGQPGRAAAQLKDAKFGDLLDQAEKFLSTPASHRRDFLKKLIAPESFNLRDFLDAVIAHAAEEVREKRSNAAFWHRLLDLRGAAQYFPLNPRLQLEALFKEQ